MEIPGAEGACGRGPGRAISPDKLTGASFTVSNLGGFGVESFTPVINPPQTGILGVCTTVQRPKLGEDGSIRLYPAMALSLTYDHRAIDALPLPRFVQELCKQLEHFTVLLRPSRGRFMKRPPGIPLETHRDASLQWMFP